MATKAESYSVDAFYELLPDEYETLARMVNAVCDAIPPMERLNRVQELRQAWLSQNVDSHLGLAFTVGLIDIATALRGESQS